MLMILARLVRSESFWAVAKVRSPHTGPEFGYPRRASLAAARSTLYIPVPRAGERQWMRKDHYSRAHDRL